MDIQTDFDFAKQRDWTIKLLGTASFRPSQGLSVCLPFQWIF
jgi:hypothetical protein